MADSHVMQLFQIIGQNHKLQAWRDINPALKDTFWLAVRAKLPFAISDVSRIYNDYGGCYWAGSDRELFYADVVKSGHLSAILSTEDWMRRKPFFIMTESGEKERVYVGKQFPWPASKQCPLGERIWYTCTTIEENLIRGKSSLGKIVEVPREGFEEEVTRAKAERRLKNAIIRETERADPIDLLPFDQHLAKEISGKANSSRGYSRYGTVQVHQDQIHWAQSYEKDYERAWKACENADFMAKYLVWIGMCREGPKRGYGGSTADKIRKNYPWSKVEQWVFHYVRKCRNLPPKDTDEWKAQNPMEALAKTNKIVEMQKRRRCPKLS